jgi:hypothetical protein
MVGAKVELQAEEAVEPAQEERQVERWAAQKAVQVVIVRLEQAAVAAQEVAVAQEVGQAVELEAAAALVAKVVARGWAAEQVREQIWPALVNEIVREP